MTDKIDNEDIMSSDKTNDLQPSWKNAPALSDLKTDFIEAKSDHSAQVSTIDTWLDNLNVTGKAKPKQRKNRSSSQPKLIRKQAEWRYASLSEPFLSTPDVFNAYGVTYEDKKAAEQNGLILNNQFNTQLNKVHFFDSYVRAAVNEGTVIVRTGWEFVEEVVEEEQDIFDYIVAPTEEEANKILMAIKLQQADPIRFAQYSNPQIAKCIELTFEQGMPITYVKKGTQMVEVTKVTKNQPTLEVCDYHNVIIDPTCNGVIENAKFVIYSFETCRADLEKDGKYKNLDKILYDSANPLSEPDHVTSNMSSFNYKDEPRKRIVAYEYWGFWDTKGDGTLTPIVATWVGDVMIRLEDNPFPDKRPPFVAVPFLPVKNSIYGEPDGALLEDNQSIIGAVVRGMIDSMGRSANGQRGTAKNALDVSNRKKFEEGEDYEFNDNVLPERAFFMHKYPEIPQSAQYMLALMNSDADALTGVKAFSEGISGTALGNTATAVRSALDATSKREMGILLRLAEGIIKVGRKIVAMNGEFLSEEEVVRVTNEQYITIKRDDLAGNIDLRLSISTAESDNQKASELSFMLQTMGNNMDPAMSRMILADIAKLRKMPELAKRIEDYQPQPDPIEQRKRELEVAKLEAEIAKLQTEAMGNKTGSMLDMAKAGTEQVKAGKLQSDKDLTDLDFVEQETGTKHARDMDKQQAQAQGNMQLEVVKAALNKDNSPKSK